MGGYPSEQSIQKISSPANKIIYFQSGSLNISLTTDNQPRLPINHCVDTEKTKAFQTEAWKDKMQVRQQLFLPQSLCKIFSFYFWNSKFGQFTDDHSHPVLEESPVIPTSQSETSDYLVCALSSCQSSGVTSHAGWLYWRVFKAKRGWATKLNRCCHKKKKKNQTG